MSTAACLAVAFLCELDQVGSVCLEERFARRRHWRPNSGTLCGARGARSDMPTTEVRN
eukprot:COSAG05_NODE_19677_length_289_cov_0.815789_1_plen_57_part_01